MKGSSEKLGISIEGGSDTSKSCIYIKDIIIGSASHRIGRLRLGDQLLDLNGQCMVGITNAEAMSVLDSAPSHVTVVVARKKPEEEPCYSDSYDEITDLATELAAAMDGLQDYDTSRGDGTPDMDELDSVFSKSSTAMSPGSPYSPISDGNMSPKKQPFHKLSVESDEPDSMNVVMRKPINARAKRNFPLGEFTSLKLEYGM